MVSRLHATRYQLDCRRARSRPRVWLSCSISVVKQRMQLQNSSYATVSQAFRSVYRAEGISAFYVSYPTTLVMTIPFTAVQFTCYEFLSVSIFLLANVGSPHNLVQLTLISLVGSCRFQQGRDQPVWRILAGDAHARRRSGRSRRRRCLHSPRRLQDLVRPALGS